MSTQNHEIGHDLNLGAYGTAFNLVGFVDEWLFGLPHYGEDLATTNDPTPDGPTQFTSTPLNMWVI